MTKNRQLEELRARNANPTGQGAADPNIGDMQESVYASSSHESTQYLLAESRPSSTPADSLVQRFRGMQATASPGYDHMMASTMSLDQLDSVYRTLRSAKASAQAQILDRTTFTKDTDNVLHFTTMVDDPYTMDNIIEYMLDRAISIDVCSSSHQSALEIAIEVGSHIGVETLLKAGASPLRRNDREQQPLHFAISKLAPANICRLLIEHDADVNAPIRVDSFAITPMRMVLDRFSSPIEEHERTMLCAILQVLVDSQAEIDSNDAHSGTMLTKFVKASIALDSTSLSVRQTQMRPSSLLQYFFSADQNPLCWFPKQYCPAHHCKSLAAFIFAHTPNSGLAAMLIESSDMVQYGLDLVRILLRPCRMRYSGADDPSTNDLLRTLLARLAEENVSGFLEPGLLDSMLEQAPRRRTLTCLETLLASPFVSRDERREALKHLYRLEEPYRLPIAELLLSQLVLALDTPWTYQEFTAHFFHQRLSQIDDYADDAYARSRFHDHVLNQLRFSPPNHDSGERIIQCVVHVFTKAMLEGKMGRDASSTERIIYMASRLRQGFQLPDIPVAKHLLLELRVVTSRQNKLLKNVHGSEVSDSSDSPETHMSDSPYAPTPESNR